MVIASRQTFWRKSNAGKYTVLQYIQSQVEGSYKTDGSNSSWLQIPYTVKTGDKLELVWSFISVPTGTSTWATIFGGGDKPSSTWRSLNCGVKNANSSSRRIYGAGYGGDGAGLGTFKAPGGTLETVVTQLAVGDADQQEDYPMTIFIQNENALGSGYTHQMTGRLYSLRIWRNDQLIFDLVPALYKGTVGLVNTVDDVFYTSMSSIPFIAGPAVELPVYPYMPLFWFDGKLNAGTSHQASTNIWINNGMTGPYYNARRENDTVATKTNWQADGALFTNYQDRNQVFDVCYSTSTEYALRLLGPQYTIGATFKIADGWRNNYSGILGCHNKWDNGTDVGLNFMQYESGSVGMGSLYRNSDQPRVFTSQMPQQSGFATGTLYNVLFVNSASYAAVYINGALYAEKTNSTTDAKVTFTNNFTIGAAYTNASSSAADGSRTFNGVIHDVYAWNRVMSAEQCAEIARYSLKRFASS